MGGKTNHLETFGVAFDESGFVDLGEKEIELLRGPVSCIWKGLIIEKPTIFHGRRDEKPGIVDPFSGEVFHSSVVVNSVLMNALVRLIESCFN